MADRVLLCIYQLVVDSYQGVAMQFLRCFNCCSVLLCSF